MQLQSAGRLKASVAEAPRAFNVFNSGYRPEPREAPRHGMTDEPRDDPDDPMHDPISI